MTITAIAIPSGPIQVAALPVDYQWRGNWNQTTTYLINDKVFRGVSTWRAIAVNTNDDPASNAPSGAWTLVALGLDPTALNAAAAIATNAATQATNSATSAAASATLAAQQISGAAAYATNAATYAQQAQGSVVQAQTAAGASTTQATLAQAWAMQLSGTVDGTYYSAYYYATAASGSATAATASASAASGSATSAASSAATSAAWAMQSTGTVDGTYYSARYYAQQAATSAQSAAAGGATPSGTFTVGNLLVAANGTGTSFTDGGRPGWLVLDNPTSPYTSVNRDEVWWSTASAAATQLLPTSPTAGTRVRVLRSGTNTVTIGQNGNTINGVASDLVLDVDKMGVELVWDAANTTWYVLHLRRG